MFDQILNSIHWETNSDGSRRYEFNPTSNKLRTRTSNPSAGCSCVLYRPLPISPCTLPAITHRSHLIITLIRLSSGPQLNVYHPPPPISLLLSIEISWNASAELEIWRFKINILIKGISISPLFATFKFTATHTTDTSWRVVGWACVEDSQWLSVELLRGLFVSIVSSMIKDLRKQIYCVTRREQGKGTLSLVCIFILIFEERKSHFQIWTQQNELNRVEIGVLHNYSHITINRDFLLFHPRSPDHTKIIIIPM